MINLVPHPAHPPKAARSVAVHVGMTGRGYRLFFFLHGKMADIVVPAASDHPDRKDGLWETTCFEAFFRGVGKGYHEFNFSPSGDWASWEFDDYRGQSRETPTAISIASDGFENLLAVEVRLNADFSHSTRLCLSAVVEEEDGTKSYWAIKHPDGDSPDFHHEDCFALSLADIAPA